MENPDFLKKKYSLHNDEEVKSAALRTKMRTGEKVPQNPSEQIQNYLNRFKEIIDRKEPEKRERGMEALKRILHDKFVIKPEEIPESYFENQRRLARELGHGDIKITKEMREQLTEVVVTDQESTLDNWIDYLSSPDATYPDWLKYYAFRSVLGMGEYDKEKKAFAKRSKGTTKPFPDINREALAYVLDAISQKYGKRHIDLLALGEEEKKEFEKLLQGENFPKLYAWALEKLTIAPSESLEKVAGKWIKYPHNSDHMPLVESLRGHGTGWCTAGESTAETQLRGGDFYVYYSLDQKGKPTVPRAAIRMQGNQIGEVRGVAPQQNLDPYIGSVVQEKLKEFPDGAVYEKKTENMKLLTVLDEVTKKQEPLETSKKIKENFGSAANALKFLYELNSSIEGFGYQRDPRIAELREGRDIDQDMPIIFECKREQIARTPEEINANTKAYVGVWNPAVLKLLPENVKHIYEKFPDKKVFLRDLELSPEIKNAKIAEKTLLEKGHQLSSWAEDILQKTPFGGEKKTLKLVSFSVESLGFPHGATTKEIFDKAKKLGLELCPAEVGPQMRLNYTDQPINEYLYLAMEPITDSLGRPHVFWVARSDDGSWLRADLALPARGGVTALGLSSSLASNT